MRISQEWCRGNTLRVLVACLGAIVRATHFSGNSPLPPLLESGLGQRLVVLGALILLLVGRVRLPLWPALPWVLFSRALVRFGKDVYFVADAR